MMSIYKDTKAYMFSNISTVKLVYKDHPRDQQNVSLYTGDIYMQVQ